MKKHIIISLSLISSLNGIEQQTTTRKPERDGIGQQITPEREPREWDAQAYDDGSKIITEAFLQFLAINKIQTEERTILDVGCGTGIITAELIKNAESAHGIDASKNMTDFAQNKYGHINNLSFEHCFAEDFQPKKLYQLGLMSFCFHWIEDKELALKRMNDSLEDGGEFFATVQTSDNPTPLSLVAAREIIEKINSLYHLFTDEDIIDLTGSSCPSDKELTSMLEQAGFEIIKQEEQSFECLISREEIIQLERPIVFSRPIMQYIPEKFIEPFFNEYIDLYLLKSPKIDDNKYLEKIITTIVHARKIKK